MSNLQNHVIVKTIPAVIILNGATGYTSNFFMPFSSGFVGLEVVLAAASNVTITQQCSSDNITWYDPIDSSGTALGQVCVGLTASSYIQPGLILAKNIRYKIVAAADSTVTITVNLVE